MFWKLHFGGNFLNRLPKRLVIPVHNCIRLSVWVTLFYSYKKKTSQVTFIDFHNCGNCINIQVHCYSIWHRLLREVSSKLWMTICKRHLDKWRFMDCFSPWEALHFFSGDHDIICFHLPQNFTRLFQPFFPNIYSIFNSNVSRWENVKCIKCQTAKVNVCSVIKDAVNCCFSFSFLQMCFSLSLLFLP